ncbi:50S ribosomal protein L30 [bacterium]|nr:50S ribosomal protein L30 [bacterium]
MADKLRIKWIKSINGAKEPHRGTIRALGFRRMNQVLEKDASPQVRGMVVSVQHLLEITEVSS